MRQITNLGGNAMNPMWINGGREILFDWADTACVNRFGSPERSWLAVDINSGRIRQLGQYLGSKKYQLSFPIAVDPRGEYAVVVAGVTDRETGANIGVLHVTPIERPRLNRLFRPGSPQLP